MMNTMHVISIFYACTDEKNITLQIVYHIKHEKCTIIIFATLAFSNSGEYSWSYRCKMRPFNPLLHFRRRPIIRNNYYFSPSPSPTFRMGPNRVVSALTYMLLGGLLYDFFQKRLSWFCFVWTGLSQGQKLFNYSLPDFVSSSWKVIALSQEQETFLCP